MADALALITQGLFFEAITAVYTNSMGDWFWALLVIIPAIMLYLFNRDTTVPLVYLVVSVTVFGEKLPAAFILPAYGLAVLVTTIVLWRLYKN